MDAKARELVGIAAAVAGHCKKCFSYHYNEAKKLQINGKDIEEAIELAKAIRSAGNKGMDEFVSNIVSKEKI